MSNELQSRIIKYCFQFCNIDQGDLFTNMNFSFKLIKNNSMMNDCSVKILHMSHNKRQSI